MELNLAGEISPKLKRSSAWVKAAGFCSVNNFDWISQVFIIKILEETSREFRGAKIPNPGKQVWITKVGILLILKHVLHFKHLSHSINFCN